MTLALDHPKPNLLSTIQAGSPVFFALMLAFSAGFAVTTALGMLDARLINGVSVWEKPAKFYLSLGVHAATLGWGLALLPLQERTSAGIRRAAVIFAIASIGELAWISLQAAQGKASHFNQADTLHQTMYALMGLGAVTLTAVTVFIGWRILRQGQNIMTDATGAGFILAGILTTLVAGYMSQQTGHGVGGDPTDATGLPFFHWSTTGGDLRVAHFAALHIAQAIPFIAWVWPDKRIVQLALLISVIVTLALLAQAMMGLPFLRA